MIKIPSPSPANAERALALTYAGASARSGLEALFGLDETLGRIVRTTRDPIVGQMRLTWWYEALLKLDAGPPPAEPVLQALSATTIPAGVSGAHLAAMTEGWEALLDSPLGEMAIDRFATERGEKLFAAAARLLAVDDARIMFAGRGWALADLSQRLSDPAGRTIARERAADLLAQALTGRWPRRARALGALAISARLDLSNDALPQGSPKRVGRLAWHRLTGY